MGRLAVKSRHRVLCGDSTSEEDVAAVMGGEVAGMVLTDPPYGIGYRSNYRGQKFDEIQGDREVSAAWVLPCAQASSGWFVFFCAWQRLNEWLAVGSEIGPLTNLLIWRKAAAMGDLAGAFAPTFEVALAYSRRAKLAGGRRPSAVFEHNIESATKFEHPTTKPVSLLAEIADALPGELILDPFLGSGTTLIAAEQLGRRCFGLEIEPRYCDVIVQRWQALTGEQAVHAETGEVFGN